MRNCELIMVLVVALTAAATAPVSAVTIRVPDHQPTIQEGIYAASEGDTVLVAPGTYIGTNNKNLNFYGVNMVLMSETGALDTIVDCEGSGRGFRANSGEDSTSVIRGFTFTNGVGSGILIGSGAAVIIEDCIISNNRGNNGGGIQYGYAVTQGVIRDCIFYGNAADHRGGGIMCDHGDPPDVAPVIRDCVFYDNDATSSTYGGGAIFCNDSSPMIIGCTMVGNAGAPGAGGIHAYSCYPVVRRTVIAFSTQGEGIYNVDADHCIIYGNPGDELPSDRDRENLAIDPLLCDLAGWDLTLCGNSPCLAGAPENPWGEHIGALYAGCGDCDSVVEETNWGSIKALFSSP